jgi:hypothetical protein
MSTSRKKDARSKVSKGELSRLLLSTSLYAESKAVKKLGVKRELEADIGETMPVAPQLVEPVLPPAVVAVTNMDAVNVAVSPLMALADAIDVRLNADEAAYAAYGAEYAEGQAKEARDAEALDDIEKERAAMLAATEYSAEIEMKERDLKKTKVNNQLAFALFSSSIFTTMPITNPVIAPLHQAIFDKNHNDLSVLIQECKKKKASVDNFNGMSVTPLWLAVKLGNVTAVELLLNANADSTKSQYGNRSTPFSLLSVEYHTKNRNVIFELMYEQQLRIYKESQAAAISNIVILEPHFNIPETPVRPNGFRY